MLVVRIEEFDKKKSRIILENNESYVLYKSERYKLEIEEGQEVTKEMEEEIYQILKKRAKKRCLYLLQKMDRTKQQLIERLKKDGYPSEIIEEAISYVEGFHYIDDTRYAKHYISSGSRTKSRRQLSFELEQKGVSSEIIREELEAMDIVEEDVVKEQIKKKYGRIDITEEKNKQKIFRYFCNKGFSYEKVKVAYQKYLEEFTQF